MGLPVSPEASADSTQSQRGFASSFAGGQRAGFPFLNRNAKAQNGLEQCEHGDSVCQTSGHTREPGSHWATAPMGHGADGT